MVNTVKSLFKDVLPGTPDSLAASRTVLAPDCWGVGTERGVLLLSGGTSHDPGTALCWPLPDPGLGLQRAPLPDRGRGVW